MLIRLHVGVFGLRKSILDSKYVASISHDIPSTYDDSILILTTIEFQQDSVFPISIVSYGIEDGTRERWRQARRLSGQ